MIRRTPIPRSQKPIKRTPIQRSSQPIKAKRKTPRRTTVLRDRGYLDWLKTQQCVVTRLHGFPMAIANNFHLHCKTRIVDPAHGLPAGMKVKGADSGAIALTRWYHEEQTRIGWTAFEEKYKFSRVEQSALLYARYLDLK